MQGIYRNAGLVLRLGMTVAALLFAQQSLAAGTTAGTDIDNLATVAYDVGGNTQTPIESAPGAGNSVPGVGQGTLTTFVVDNRVDFTLTPVGTHKIVNPGETDAFVEFTLTNTGNSAQDFRMVATNLASTDPAVFGLLDTDADMLNLRVRVDNDANGVTLADLDYADELGEDASVTLYVFVDADVTVVNGDIANVDLEVTAADAGVASTLGSDTTDDAGNADDPTVVQNVLAEGGALGDGTLNVQHGFQVESAALVISKVATLISDPFNNTGADRKAIPGAVVEYVITIDNSAGTSAATNVVVTDALNDVTIVSDFYGGTDEFELDNGGTVTTCTEQNDPPDLCEFAAGAITIGVAAPAAGIDIAAGDILTATFRVTID